MGLVPHGARSRSSNHRFDCRNATRTGFSKRLRQTDRSCDRTTEGTNKSFESSQLLDTTSSSKSKDFSQRQQKRVRIGFFSALLDVAPNWEAIGNGARYESNQSEVGRNQAECHSDSGRRRTGFLMISCWK